MGTTSGWARRVAPVCPPIARDLAAGLSTSLLGTLPFAAWAGLRDGAAGLMIAGMIGTTGGLALGAGANLFAARRGRRLTRLAAALGSACAVAGTWLCLGAHSSAAQVGLHALTHVGWAAAALGYPRVYRWLWGVRARNWFPRRRWDPVDPLGA